jgi:hypothetical protein
MPYSIIARAITSNKAGIQDKRRDDGQSQKQEWNSLKFFVRGCKDMLAYCIIHHA